MVREGKKTRSGGRWRCRREEEGWEEEEGRREREEEEEGGGGSFDCPLGGKDTPPTTFGDSTGK